MKYTKATIYFLLSLILFSCSESETEKSIRDMVFNQNNNAIGNTLPTSNVLNFSPSSVDFGTVQNGTNNSRVITISNSFNAPVNISVTHTNSVSQVTYNVINFQIPAGGTYQFTVNFSPTATMFLSDVLHFSYPANLSNSIGSITQNVNLTGSSLAILPTTLSVTPTGTLDFGDVVVGQSATRNITLINSGSATANWTPVGSVFTATPSSGAIAIGSSQSVALSFTANSVGVYTSTLTISYNGGTLQIPYTVNRIAMTRILGVSCTSSTAFGNVPINATITKTITISNTGNSILGISQITTSQVPNGQFTCSYSGVIPANSSVNVPISFKPTSSGSKTCTINIQANQTNGSGVGITSLTFNGFGI